MESQDVLKDFVRWCELCRHQRQVCKITYLDRTEIICRSCNRVLAIEGGERDGSE
jgi:hypothetical protein